MFKKLFVLSLIFYCFSLFQTSFVPYFQVLGQTPNLVLIALFLTIFFNFLPSHFPLEAILAGFFLDAFSNYPVGVSAFFLFLTALLMKKILKSFKETNIFIFLFLFLIFYFVYYSFLFAFDYVLEKSTFALDFAFLIQIIYNLVFATFLFYLCLLLKHQKILKIKR